MTDKKIQIGLYLILQNIVQIIGILFFNWSALTTLFSYLIESLVVSFFFLLTIGRAKYGFTPKNNKDNSVPSEPNILLRKERTWLILFFTIHQSIYLFGHYKILQFINVFPWMSSELSTKGTIPLLIVLLIVHGKRFQEDMSAERLHEPKLLDVALISTYKRIFILQTSIILSSIFLTLPMIHFPKTIIFFPIIHMLISYRINQKAEEVLTADKTSKPKQPENYMESIKDEKKIKNKRNLAIILVIQMCIAVPIFLFGLRYLASINKNDTADQQNAIDKTMNFEEFGFSITFPNIENRAYTFDTKEITEYPVVPHSAIFFSIDAKDTSWITQKFDFGFIRVIPIDVFRVFTEVQEKNLVVIPWMEESVEKYLGTHIGENGVFAITYTSAHQDCPRVSIENDITQDSPVCNLLFNTEKIQESIMLYDPKTQSGI